MPLSAAELALLRSHLASLVADVAALVADTPAPVNVASSGGGSSGSALVGMQGQAVGGSGGGAVSVTPSPPPPSGLGDIISKPINMAKTLMMAGFMAAPVGYDPGRYERQQSPCILRGNSALFRATTNNFAAGGVRVPFGAATTLTLLFDDKPVATQNVLAMDSNVLFSVDLTNIAEGWYRTSVSGLDATWSVLDYAAYVLKGTVAQPQTKMPVVTGSYTLAMMGAPYTHKFAWVPAQFTPTIMPLAPRECPAFSDIPKRTNLVLTQVVHGRFGDTYRPCVTKEGLLVSANKQPYMFFDFQQPKPIMPLLDGPRGRGTLFCATHLEIGIAAPTAAESDGVTGLIPNIYFTDPWRVGKVRASGEVVTLAGWRHKDVPQFWGDPINAELVGDWSSIPVARRGFNELWGLAWRIPGIDYAHAVIPTEKLMHPHKSDGPGPHGVQAFAADQRTVMPNGKGRLVKLQFDPLSHYTPPVVTEFHGDGWNQCFDVVSNGNVNPVQGAAIVSDADFRLWASDRMGHRIRVFDMNANEVETWTGIPQPEGLALFERADGLWLYYTSTVRAGATEGGGIINFYIRRRHTVTKEDVLIVDCKATIPYFINNNTLLGKIAVSDGTFGPRGMIAYTTWSNSYYGYPILLDGDTGAMIDFLTVKQYVDAPPRGIGTPGQTYTSAAGIGSGRMVYSTACDGLTMISHFLPTDTVLPAAVALGEKEWHDNGYIQTHGHYGMGQYGLPLPWGKSENIDAFLTAHGHTRA